MSNSYPPRELQEEIKSLLLRVGITPTRSIMDRVKSLTERQALRARGILVTAAVKAEQARSAHPEGRRATDRQLADWDKWMSSTGTEVTPEALAHFLNLDTKSANMEIMRLRFIFWGERDAKGKTTSMRAARGLVTGDYVPPKDIPQANDPTKDVSPVNILPAEVPRVETPPLDVHRRLTFEEL